MLIHVLLHEISHVLCKSTGHTQEFTEIFDELVREAEALGIVEPGYVPLQNYCNYPSLCEKFPIVCPITPD
jgi:hypothetical protein